MVGILVVLFSTLAAADKESKNGAATKVSIGYIVIWGLVALVNTCYNSWWDLSHDWGLLKPNVRHRYLRARLTYSPNFYYFAIISNTLCRMGWTFSLSIGMFDLPSLAFTLVHLFSNPPLQDFLMFGFLMALWGFSWPLRSTAARCGICFV